jgi:cell division septation protein DedD
MLRRVFVFGALIFSATAAAQGQTAARAAEAAFARAQEMASDGNSAGGRALIDSIVRTTPPASPIYPQALYWRATLATNAADAESDYRHIVVDYPLAPQAEDALLRLAQLELARGDRDDALVHLQRIPRDYPRSKSIARASYWIARVLFEKNDIPGACAANATALAQTAEGEVELRNQIQYQSQRCAAFAASQRAAASSSSAGTASSTPTAITASSTPKVAEKPPVSRDTSIRETVTAAPVASIPRVSAPTTARDTKPSQVQPNPALPSAADAPASAATPGPSAPSRAWSVQVAAYNRKPDAENLVATLGKRGYDARVDGTVAPFRVRIGRYPTAREAEVALAEIKSKKMAGFVVRAP